MAVTVKESFNAEIIREDPKVIQEKPPLRPETPRDGEDATEIAARDLKDKLARGRVVLENEERRARGPRICHKNHYNEVQKKLVSRKVLFLGTEGKQRFLLKNPHAEVSKISIKAIIELASDSFRKVKCLTYKKKLCTKTQVQGETPEAFHAALTAQAARSELGTLQGDIVRDLFISKKKNMTLQDTLTFETLTTEEILTWVIKFEHSNLTTMVFQKKMRQRLREQQQPTI